jgi:cbb3-type cytochrome oxidase subunit 1
MDRYVTRFLRASLLWLVAGVTLGAAMAIHPPWQIYRAAHLHLLLLGFVVMMISGVAYHVLPRFAATPLYSGRLASIHVVVANVGLALFIAGFGLRAHAHRAAPWLLGSGGALSAIGAYLLVWNLWRTLDRAILPAARLQQLRPR